MLAEKDQVKLGLDHLRKTVELAAGVAETTQISVRRNPVARLERASNMLTSEAARGTKPPAFSSLRS